MTHGLQQGFGMLAMAGFPADLVRTALALAGVLILFWVVVRWLGARRLGPAARWDAAVQVLRRIPLDRRKHLYLVRVADRILLLGAGDTGPPTLIADLDPDALERVSQSTADDRYG